MNRKVLILVIGFLFCSYINGQSHIERFWTAFNVKDMVNAEKVLREWDLYDANDAELYVAYFNFYTVKSIESKSTDSIKKYSPKALEFITEGIDRFPTRFDMRVAKIYMLDELKDYNSFTSEVIKMIEASVNNKGDWKGEDFTLIENAEDMFHGAVLDFQGILFEKEDTSLFKDIMKISEVMQKHYPNHNQSRITMSTLYIAQKEYDKSLKTLLDAEKIEPENAILLYNIAYVYSEKGDKANAKKYYELTVANTKEKEEPLKDAARKQLELLR